MSGLNTTINKEKIIKAWVRFTGSGTLAIEDSYNVASVVDNSEGNYTVNWDNDFSNSDNCVTCTYAGETNPCVCRLTSHSAGSVTIAGYRRSDGVVEDGATVSVIAIGDQ